MTPRSDRLDRTAILLLVGCCLFWGFQQVLVKVTLRDVAPIWQASLRFALALAALAAWARARRAPLFARDGTLGAGLVAGVLFTLEFVGIYLGLQHTSVSRLTIFLYTAPFWVAGLLAALRPADRLSTWQWLGLGLAFAGVVIAFRGGLSLDTATWRGDLLGLMGGAAWGLTTVVIRTTPLAGASAEKMLFYQVGVCALVLPLLSLALGETWTLSFGSFAAGSIVLQALGGAFGTYLLWMWMLGRYPATKMAAFTFLVPVFALGFGVALLGEPLTAGLVVALACVAGGIVLVNRRR